MFQLTPGVFCAFASLHPADDDDDSASAASVMTDPDDDEADKYSTSSSGDSEESDDDDDDEDEQPLKPAKILYRKTLKPSEWRQMCKDMNTDQVCAVVHIP